MTIKLIKDNKLLTVYNSSGTFIKHCKHCETYHPWTKKNWAMPRWGDNYNGWNFQGCCKKKISDKAKRKFYKNIKLKIL